MLFLRAWEKGLSIKIRKELVTSNGSVRIKQFLTAHTNEQLTQVWGVVCLLSFSIKCAKDIANGNLKHVYNVDNFNALDSIVNDLRLQVETSLESELFKNWRFSTLGRLTLTLMSRFHKTFHNQVRLHRRKSQMTLRLPSLDSPHRPIKCRSVVKFIRFF